MQENAEGRVTRTERGWAGHFICSDRCRFRRNTLLELGPTKIVVSTVGLMTTLWEKGSNFYSGEFEEIGFNRYYETMAFMANPEDTRYHDIDVTREVPFNSPSSISEVDADDKANKMHEQVVKEIISKMKNGEVK